MLKLTVLLFVVAGALGKGFPAPRPYLQADVTHPGQEKIIGGINANPGQFPYIVSLNYAGDGHACGASILTSNWVLTAAHCCSTGYALNVYTNSIYLSSGGTTFDIAEYRIHPQYDADNYWHNDICLIRINGNIALGPNAQQVTLIGSGVEVPDGGTVVIPGWGYTTPNSPQVIPDRLQVITDYHALSIGNCYQRTGVPQFDGHICAISNAGQATCQGDSGGPLTYNGAQVGIVSFGFVPCGSGYPDFFARVANYIPWIQQQLGREAELLKIANTLEEIL